MKKTFLLFIFILFTSPAYAADETVYYARCNIRVLSAWEGISWKNWLAAPVKIPAGTKIITKPEYGTVYGARGAERKVVSFDAMLEDGGKLNLPDEPREKYLLKDPIDLNAFSPEQQEGIKKAEPVRGMTKEMVFAALCAPSYVPQGTMGWQSTENLSVEEIKKADKWVYQRKKLGKKFVVEFNEQGHADKLYWKIM